MLASYHYIVCDNATLPYTLGTDSLGFVIIA